MDDTNIHPVREMTDDELLKTIFDELDEIRDTEPKRYQKNLSNLANVFESNGYQTSATLCKTIISLEGLRNRLNEIKLAN